MLYEVITLPKSEKDHGLRKGEFSIDDEALLTVIRRYTREAGVRNLERELATLARKAVKELLTSKKKSVKVTDVRGTVTAAIFSAVTARITSYNVCYTKLLRCRSSPRMSAWDW